MSGAPVDRIRLSRKAAGSKQLTLRWSRSSPRHTAAAICWGYQAASRLAHHGRGTSLTDAWTREQLDRLKSTTVCLAVPMVLRPPRAARPLHRTLIASSSASGEMRREVMPSSASRRTLTSSHSTLRKPSPCRAAQARPPEASRIEVQAGGRLQTRSRGATQGDTRLRHRVVPLWSP